MPTDEDRRALFAAAETAFGARAANTLMELLPPAGWADVAMRIDVESLGNQVRREMADMRTELRGEMADLRIELKGEMGGLRSETVAIRTELGAKLDALGAELRGEMRSLEGRMTHMAFVTGLSAAGLVVGAGAVALGLAAIL